MAGGRDDRTMRALRLGILGAVLVVGWAFIAWQNSFHVTPPLVFVGLGYLAVVLTTYNLWRTGAAAVAPNDEDDGDASWGRPTGALGELDREKRTLLKAIKEAEFDHAMGKLSQADAHQMVQMYRARAIEVMKEVEQLELGAAGTVRERILREVKARVALDGRLARDKASRVVVDDDAASYGSGIGDGASVPDAAEPAAVAAAVEAPSVASDDDLKRAAAAHDTATTANASDSKEASS